MSTEYFDPRQFGVDIATSSEGDLRAEANDFATVGGVANVVGAFIRELTTPYGYLARYVYDVEGLKILDEHYGNPGHFALSEPLTQEWIDNQITAIQQVAANQPLINLHTVDHLITNDGQARVQFHIRFTIARQAKPFNLVLVPLRSRFQAGLEAA